MLARIAAVVAIALSFQVAAATPIVEARAGSCNKGNVACCNEFKKTDQNLLNYLTALGVNAAIDEIVGLHCTPITGVIGVGGNTCQQQTTCCTGNAYNGLIAVGCVPVQVGI